MGTISSEEYGTTSVLLATITGLDFLTQAVLFNPLNLFIMSTLESTTEWMTSHRRIGRNKRLTLMDNVISVLIDLCQWMTFPWQGGNDSFIIAIHPWLFKFEMNLLSFVNDRTATSRSAMPKIHCFSPFISISLTQKKRFAETYPCCYCCSAAGIDKWFWSVIQTIEPSMSSSLFTLTLVFPLRWSLVQFQVKIVLGNSFSHYCLH